MYTRVEFQFQLQIFVVFHLEFPFKNSPELSVATSPISLIWKSQIYQENKSNYRWHWQVILVLQNEHAILATIKGTNKFAPYIIHSSHCIHLMNVY